MSKLKTSLTLLIVALGVTTNTRAAVYDLDNNQMAVPDNLIQIDSGYVIDSDDNYYMYKPTQINQNSWVYGCPATYETISDMLKLNSESQDCNLQMIGHNREQAELNTPYWLTLKK